jgi:hypothetical protein
VKIPLLQGAYADSSAAFHTSYPINLEPTLVSSGLSEGYISDVPGCTQIGTGPGADRGSINWNGVCYRVMGPKLVSVASDNTITVLGDVGNDGKPVSLDYSFDRLVIWSNLNQFYWCTPSGPNPGLTQVTDPDLGSPIAGLWIDSYFMSTDGENLVVTELNDPYSVDPLKYGSAEADPDPVVGLAKVRGEVYALGTNTIQNFQDLGGTGFPFTNNPGGLIPRGVVGTHAWAYFLETFAFVGSGRNEQLSVYLAGAGQSISISTSEIDGILAGWTDAEQALIECEARVEKGEQRFYIHGPDKTLVYMHQASLLNKDPVWHILADGALMDAAYSPRHMVQVYDKWLVGDSTGRVGYLDDTTSLRWGNIVGWQFDTVLIWGEGKGGLVKVVELFGLPGRAPFGVDPTCALSWTFDGQTWSQERFISMGGFGERRRRVQWRPKFRFANYVGLRFRSANASIATWAALTAEIEPLSV